MQLRLTGKPLGAALTALEDAASKRADAALRDVLRRGSLLPGEKAFVSRAVFAYYRWFGWLDPAKPPSSNLRHALELAGQFQDKPASFPDADLIKHSVPEWAHQVLAVTPALARELQREPRLWLRARGGDGQALASLLGDCELHPKYPGAVWYQGNDDLYHSFEFKRGEFEIQDLSSQIVGHSCNPQPGETWWDACAGEGGKTLHLAGLMQGQGLVWATDPADWRIANLKKRAARAQIYNYRFKVWANKAQLPTKTKFDGVLVDAPCSGLGTWGRNPQARWTTTLKDVHELALIQKDLLAKAAAAVKPGACLVYSVCTLARPESAEVADHFEATHPAFQPHLLPNPLKAAHRSHRLELHPQELHANGMFIAAWSKTS